MTLLAQCTDLSLAESPYLRITPTTIADVRIASLSNRTRTAASNVFITIVQRSALVARIGTTNVTSLTFHLALTSLAFVDRVISAMSPVSIVSIIPAFTWWRQAERRFTILPLAVGLRSLAVFFVRILLRRAIVASSINVTLIVAT